MAKTPKKLLERLEDFTNDLIEAVKSAADSLRPQPVPVPVPALPPRRR